MTAVTPTLSLLESRGIAAQATAAGWIEHSEKGRAGWAFPIFNIKGQPYPAKKWKSADGQHPKCQWLYNKPDFAKYYFLPGTISEIANRNGSAYLASGEPDVLAYRAAGIMTAFCWLDGEGSPPASLVSDLGAMGVGNLFYYPDRDQAGLASAAKLMELLDGSGIETHLFQLPGDVGSKNDINQLWIACQFDKDRFQVALCDCSPLDAVDTYLYSHAPKTGQTATQVDSDVKGWRDEWIQQIIKALGAPAQTEAGKDRWHCPLPGHDDGTPSFRISYDKVAWGWPMCSCGIQDDKEAWERVAEAKGVETWQEFKTLKAAERGYVQTAPRARKPGTMPNSAPQLPARPARWVDSHDVLRQLKTELLSPVPLDAIMPPVLFPYTTFRRYRGGARFMRAGKLTGVTGVTGGGKTTFAMSLVISLLQLGYDVVWWGPEWSPEEYMETSLQRAGGLTVDQQDTLRIWKIAEREGESFMRKLAEGQDLTRPTQGDVQRSGGVIDKLLASHGHIYFLPDMESPIETVLLDMRDCVKVKRAEGRHLPVFVVDYVQLAKTTGRQDWTYYERIVSHVKAACSWQAGNIHGIITSQSRKDDVESVYNGSGKVNISSSQGVSSNQFNLFLTLTPEFNSEGKMLDVTEVGISKNSRGERGILRLRTDLAHGAILDMEAGGLSPARYGNGEHVSDSVYRGSMEK